MDDIEIYPYRRTRSAQAKRTGKRFQLRNIWPPKKLPKFRPKLKGIFRKEQGLAILMGFILSRAIFLWELNPFIGALIAVFTYRLPQTLPALLLAAGLGVYQVYSGLAMWSMLATIVAIGVTVRLIPVSKKNYQWVLPGLVFALTMIAKSSIVAWVHPDYYRFVVVLVEAILATGITLIVNRAFMAGVKLFRQQRLTAEEIIYLAVLLGGMLTGLNNLSLGSLSVQGIASKWIILVAGYLIGMGGGAAIGTLVGLVPSLATMTPPLLAGIYAFAGLLAGTSRFFGRLGVCLGFMLSNIILTVYLISPESWAGLFGETAMAIACFFALPTRWLKPLDRSKITLLNKEAGSDEQERMTKERLAKFAGVFEQLAQTFEELAAEKQIESEAWQNVLQNVGQKACGDCTKYHNCWEKDFYHTYKHILDFMSWVELNGNISSNQLSEEFKKRCHRPREMAVAINCLFEAKRAHRYWQRQIIESREVLSCQLKGLSSVMDNLAEVMLEDKWETNGLKWPYNIEVGVAKVAKEGSQISGDSFSTLWLPEGKAAIILSDGMGTGQAAAKESSATVELLGNLLESGMNEEVAVRTVNSLLVMGARDETFATVDLAIIDLQSAKADFIKIGAAASFVKRGPKVGMIKSNSWPIGILHTVEFEVVTQQLKPGDLLVMVTDGVVEGSIDSHKEEWILDFLQKTAETKPQNLAVQLLNQAQFDMEKNYDDMTVIVISLGDSAKGLH